MVIAAALVSAAPSVPAADDDDSRICLASRGAAVATPPAVRLNGSYQIGPSGEMLRDMMTGAAAMMSRYMPGALDRPAGPARWLFEGAAEAQAGRPDEAWQLFTRCSSEAAQARDAVVEAACSNNLGAVAAVRGRYAEARTWFERAARQYREVQAGLPTAAELARRQAAYEARMEARFEAAAATRGASAADGKRPPPSQAEIRAMREQAARLQIEAQRQDPEASAQSREQVQRIASALGSEMVALNLANLALALGQWEEALAHLKQALAGYDGRLTCRPAALDDLLRLREKVPNKGEINALVERYPRAVKPASDGTSTNPFEVGVLALGGTAPATPTPALARPTATRAGDESTTVKLFADPLSATGEAGLQDLLARAAAEERQGQREQARRSFVTATLRAQAAGRAEIEATAHAALMRLEAAAGRPATAIFHGKRAANLLQELRGGGADLSRAARRTYLREREQTYGRLAELLIQAGRLVEAERVLQMLKEDEGRQFIAAAARPAYARLTETAEEAGQRTAGALASQALRRSDDERAAVGADRTYAVLLASDRASIERSRLRAAGELRAFIDPAAGSAAELGRALGEMPLEHQKPFLALFADGGRGFLEVLRALNEDAPRFRATPATPQQLAQIADTLRRADELRTALTPVLDAMRRKPAPTMAAMVQREQDPARLMQQPSERLDQQFSHQQALGQDPAAAAKFAALARGQQQAFAGAQRAIGPAMQAYQAALAGQEDRAALAAVGPALRGATPEALDGFLNFVRQAGQQMQQASQARGPLGPPAAAPPTTPEALVASLRSLLRRGKDGADGAAAPPLPAAAPPAGDASAVARVQAQLEAAVEKARASAGRPVLPAAKEQLAVLMPPEQKSRGALEPPQLAMAEPLGRLWRIEQARLALEERTVEDLATAAQRLEKPHDALPAAADESATALAALGVPTALVYLLPQDGGVDALLIGPQGRRAWRLPLPRAELDPLTQAFGSALRDPTTDPRPAARALYERLFAPLALALRAAQVQVVALSLSGSLRFVPFAALHDGEGWLAERFAFALNPGGRLADLLKPASGSWQVAAFGTSQGGANLPPLQGVAIELDMIVQQGARGALPGRRWLDGAFTAQALRGALGDGSQVVHIASHFKFEPGDAARSFLLLGDGERLSLKDLGGPGYRFDRTELVTLSACQTGVSADDAFGQEVDGLAALLMAQGAPSVLASLWQVADGSTAQLMGAMYGLHAKRAQHPLGRAQALQQAQLSMIRGPGAPATRDEGEARRGIDRPPVTGAGAGAALRGAHPYHWAPFVLMGSWL